MSKPQNFVEGLQQAESFTKRLETLVTEKIGDALNLQNVIETLGENLDELVSLEAVLLYFGDRKSASKLLSIGVILGILYEKKVQEKAQVAVGV